MIRRHVLAALAAGVEAGDDEAARDALSSADWVLRRPAQRELRRAVFEAACMCGEWGTTYPESVRHVHRVAALNLAGRYDVDITNRRDVMIAYESLVTPAPPRAPVATVFAGSAVALLVLLVVWLGITIRTPERPARPTPPLVSGAFFHGGTPARDAELERHVIDELSALVLETAAERRGSSEGAPRAQHAKELRDSKLIAARGPGLANAWRSLIDALDHWTDVRRSHTQKYRAAVADLGRRAQDVSEQFAALGLGLYLQSDVMIDRAGEHAMIFVFAVEDVVFVKAGGQARRVLGLRRLDRLNLRHALLGRQGDELGDPVVLLDQIDDFATNRVMPALHGYAYPLGDAQWRAHGSGRLLAHVAGDAIRRELTAELGAEAAGNPAVAKPHVTRIVTASVRRHEARHGIDIDRATPLRLPSALAAYLGTKDDTRFELHARAELAGYLSQIGNEPVTPQLALWNIASQTFNRERRGTVEAYVGAVIIEGLARQLGFNARRAVPSADGIDRARLAVLAEPLAGQSSEKLRAAARQLWIELYGEPMLPIVDLLR